MSIKKFFPLLALVVILFVGFGYIKPAVDSIFAKIEEKDVKTEELRTMRRTLDNFGNLVSERERILAQESGRMAMEYIPTSAEQERMTDIVNQLSLRSGVIVDSVSVKASRKPSAARSEAIVLENSSKSATPPSAPDLESLSVDINVRGTYESMKEFLSELASAGRLHEVVTFSMTEKGSADKEGGPTGTLVGSVSVMFFAMPELMYPNAPLLPIFESGVFDTGPLEKLRASSEQLPALPGRSGGGRSNPFVL